MGWEDKNYKLVKTRLRDMIWVPSHAAGVIRRKGLLDIELLDCIGDLFSRPGLETRKCVDIGANIGNHTLFFSKIFEKVFSFEPLVEKLPTKENISLNKASNVSLYDFGLSNQNTTQEMYVSPHDGHGASTLQEGLARTGASKIPVHTRIGDEILGDFEDVDLIKVDVEGHEAEVFAGLQKTITRNRPVVVLEWNNENTKDEFKRLNIQQEVLNQYTFYGVFSPTDKRISKNLFWRFLHKISNKLGAKSYQLVEFKSHLDFPNVIAIPNEKSSLLHDLR